MFNETIQEIEWGGATLTLKTGKIARQCDGAVMVSMGDTVVLCTAVSNKEPKPDIDFFPLTVHYREMFFAAGKFPGGFIKREGRASEKEILIARLIDRPIRPLFHSGFFNETQVICTVLSHDSRYSSDILAMIGSSAALAISGVPYMDIVAASKIGFVNGEYVLNPSNELLEKSQLELIVAGTETSVMMVESEAKELSEEQMLGAVEFGHKQMQPVINLIKKLVVEAGKPKWPLPDLGIEHLEKVIAEEVKDEVIKAFQIRAKQARYQELGRIKQHLLEKYEADFGALKVGIAFEEVKSKIVRHKINESKLRIDNRTPNEIRPIIAEAQLLPKTHGSALFTRGETQALVVSTLGTGQDEQIVETLYGEHRERFLLNYIFPPYAVGEASPFRAPGRREIGHSKLAWRALNPVLPTKAEFPYTMRIVSEITECNGSSSMATVCGASMALMDAGVPLKGAVAGIAMGLILEGKEYTILSDILGDEDHLGDMDFKVAGTKEGITALQMDIKVNGITHEIMQAALSQAKEGRLHILDKMIEGISAHRAELSPHAPQIKQIKIDKDKIRELIGPGGKVIKEICEMSGAKIDISDEGLVQVAAVGAESMEIALARIKAIIFEPEVGDIMDGTIVKILDSGAFVNIGGGKDGYLHISEISNERIANINDYLKVGQIAKVKVIEFDKGKIKVSMKALLSNDAKPEAKSNESKEEPQSSSKPEKREEKQNVDKKPGRKNDSQSNNDEPVVTDRKYFN